jgi:hypothetical protein
MNKYRPYIEWIREKGCNYCKKHPDVWCLVCRERWVKDLSFSTDIFKKDIFDELPIGSVTQDIYDIHKEEDAKFMVFADEVSV